MIGWVPQEIYHGGIWYYLSHPWVLFEVVLFLITMKVWLRRRGHFHAPKQTLTYLLLSGIVLLICYLGLPILRSRMEGILI